MQRTDRGALDMSRDYQDPQTTMDGRWAPSPAMGPHLNKCPFLEGGA